MPPTFMVPEVRKLPTSLSGQAGEKPTESALLLYLAVPKGSGRPAERRRR